jgi:hypothetical protein
MSAWFEKDDRVVIAAANTISRTWRYKRRMSPNWGQSSLFYVSRPLLERTIKNLEDNSDGFTSLLRYLLATVIFFTILVMQKDPTSAFTVERALYNHIMNVELPGLTGGGLADIESIPDVYDWVDAFLDKTYVANNVYSKGSQDAHACNTCAILMTPLGQPAVNWQCGPSQSHLSTFPAGACWNTNGRAPSSQQFCDATCYPDPNVDCAWTKQHAMENTALPGVDSATFVVYSPTTLQCVQKFCSEDCPAAGVLPEMPYFANPTLPDTEKEAAMNRMYELQELLNFAKHPGNAEKPSMNFPGAAGVREVGACAAANGKANRQFIKGTFGRKLEMSNSDSGTTDTGFATTTSKMLGLVILVQKRRKQLDKCSHAISSPEYHSPEAAGTERAASLEDWYGNCYDNDVEAKSWPNAGYYLDATGDEKSWYSTNTTSPWSYNEQVAPYSSSGARVTAVVVLALQQ